MLPLVLDRSAPLQNSQPSLLCLRTWSKPSATPQFFPDLLAPEKEEKSEDYFGKDLLMSSPKIVRFCFLTFWG